MQPGKKVTKETVSDRLVYHWVHDQQDISIWGIAELDAPLLDDKIKKTLDIMIQYAPIINTTLKRKAWSGYWAFAHPQPTENLMTRNIVKNRDAAKQLIQNIYNVPLDTNEPPVFRVLSIDAQDAHYLVLQVHHLIVDGEGAKLLFQFFAKIYRNLEKDPSWLPDAVLNMNRSWFQFAKFLKWYKILLAPVFYFKESINSVIYLLRYRKTANVINGDFSGVSPGKSTTDPAFESFKIDSSGFNRIRRDTSVPEAKINDYMMAALMTTVCQWNVSRGQDFSYVYTCYTANLRKWWGQPEGVFAHMSVIRMVWAKREQLMDVKTALKTIKPKIDKAKKEFGLKEIYGLLVISIQPGLVCKLFLSQLITFAKKSHAITNVGSIPDHTGDFGSVKAQSYSIQGPGGPSQNVAFLVSGYKNSLTIYCNYSRIHMKPETVRRFIKKFKNNLLEFGQT